MTMMHILLTVFQILNFLITILFLILFYRRYRQLKLYSETQRFKNFYPKWRILFAVIYIGLSIALLTYNLVTMSYDETMWYQYLLQGGGGEIINSFILVVQLFVLRLELIKERPYTRCHLVYFGYLFGLELIRTGLTVTDYVNQKNDLANVVISSLFVVDCSFQFFYWIAKKQELPQFQKPSFNEIDHLRNHSNLLNFVNQQTKSFWKSSDQSFVFLKPSVSLEHGRYQVILQIIYNKHVIQQLENTSPQLLVSQQVSIHEDLLNIKEPSLSKNSTKSDQIVAKGCFTLEELKYAYTICGRICTYKDLSFEDSPQEITVALQEYLDEIFKQKRSYQMDILQVFKVKPQILEFYRNHVKKSTTFNNNSSLDETTGQKKKKDKNATFFHVQFFRHLWISDHYEFYIKIQLKNEQIKSYPVHRYSNFEQLHNSLKNIAIKCGARYIQLPSLPKKILFMWHYDEQIIMRRNQLQIYLKKLCNDYTIMEVYELRQKILNFLNFEGEFKFQPNFSTQFYQELAITKGQITKQIIKGDYVTFYEFKIFKKGIQIKKLIKRFTEFEELHRQLMRWMSNIQICYKMISLPQKHLFKSEKKRHEKLRNYLQSVVDVKQIGKIYAANIFFNPNDQQQESQISQIQHQSSLFKKQNNTTSRNVIKEIIELKESVENKPFSSDFSQKYSRFSEVLDNLGDYDLDEK